MEMRKEPRGSGSLLFRALCGMSMLQLLKPLHGMADSSFLAQSAPSAFPLGPLRAQDFLVKELLSMLCPIK